MTLMFLPRKVHKKCFVVPPNALRPQDEQQLAMPRIARNGQLPFHLLYVGNCVATRAIPLVFEALQQAALPQYRFTIVGSGPALAHWRKLARQMRLDAFVTFTGAVPYQQLPRYYEAASALVFP